MVEALPSNASHSVPDTLATGARALYAKVLKGSGGRENALPLLAADALLTHAFQAQAEIDPSELRDFASRWSRDPLGPIGP